MLKTNFYQPLKGQVVNEKAENRGLQFSSGKIWTKEGYSCACRGHWLQEHSTTRKASLKVGQNKTKEGHSPYLKDS